MAKSNSLAGLRGLKSVGYTCPCCRDTGSHMFGTERRDCEHCGYCNLNNKILYRLPATLNELAEKLYGWHKDTLAEHVATMHKGGRVKFKNNGKQGVLIVRIGEGNE